MSVADEAKSWFEAVQRIIGLSVEQMFGLLAPALLAVWNLSVLGHPHSHDWPAQTPLTWIATVARSGGAHGTWALHMHSWLHDRPSLYLALLVAAGIFTALSNGGRTRTALLGLGAFAYMAALEIHNSAATLFLYLGISVVPCVVAIVGDLRTDSERSGHISFPSMSVMRWATCVAIVGFGWITLPILVALTAVAGYRVEAPLRLRSVPSGAIDPGEGSRSRSA